MSDKYRSVTVKMLYDEGKEPMRFFYQNGGGKFALFECSPSKDEHVDEFLREAFPNEEKETQERRNVILTDPQITLP